MKLDKTFYLNADVVDVAKKLIGKELHTHIGGVHQSGIIVETEAYSYKEKACHAYLKRNTRRTKTMFSEGGIAYIYLCYGIHHLLNVVTNKKDIPEAVLIRALQPLEDVETRISSGPGKLTKFLNIHKRFDGISLIGNTIWIEQNEASTNYEIDISKRIGIDYAEEDAQLPWRFTAKGNKWISK